MSDLKVLIIWDRSGHYHYARARALQQRVQGSVCLADLGSSDALYRWNIEGADLAVCKLSGKAVEQADFVRRVLGFIQLLRRENPDAVAVAGYAHPSYWAILILCRVLRKPVVLFSESWYPRGKVRDFLKGSIIRLFCGALMVSGERAATHCAENLGVPKRRIIDRYSTVDNIHFQRQRPQRGHVLLCVARFVREKNLEMLVEAFSRANLTKDRELWLVGSGPLERELRKVRHPRIIVRDWAGYEDMPMMYSQAEWLILPSLFEPWGLVVNEAMAAGVPVIASECCGCVPDLVDASTGYTFDPMDVSDLIDALERAVGLSDAEWIRLSEGARYKIDDWGVENWAENFLEAVKVARED